MMAAGNFVLILVSFQSQVCIWLQNVTQ